MTALGILIIWQFIIESRVAIDWLQIKKKRSIMHGLELFFMIIIALAFAVYVAGVKSANEWAMDVFVYMIASYWLEFDGLLSLHRGLNFFYVSKDPDSANTDKFFFKNFPLYIGTKIAALILTIASMIWIIKDFVNG